MLAGQICTRVVDTAKPNESVSTAAKRMYQLTVRSLVVIDDAHQPIGIVTDRDFLGQVLAKGRSSMDTLVRDVMTPGPKTVSEETPIEKALALMREGRFRRLPVTGPDRKLVGLISVDDILMQLAGEFAQINLVLEKERPRDVITG